MGVINRKRKRGRWNEGAPGQEAAEGGRRRERGREKKREKKMEENKG